MEKLARHSLWILTSIGLAAGPVHARGDGYTSDERHNLRPGAGPLVVDTTIVIQVRTGKKIDAKHQTHDQGWSPNRLTFDVWGKVGKSDLFTVDWKDGAKVVATTECDTIGAIDDTRESDGDWFDQGNVSCSVKDDSGIAISKPGSYTADIKYTSAGQPAKTIRTLTYTVRNTKANPTAAPEWYVDHDDMIGQTDAYWDWDGNKLGVRAVVKSTDPNMDGDFQCTVDGKPAEGSTNLKTEQIGGLDDNLNNKHYYWIRLVGTIDGYRAAPKGNAKVALRKPGKYECKFLVKAKVWRTVRFTLQNDGHDTIALSGEQGKMPGSFVSRTTFVSDVDIPAGVDAPFERDAVLKRAMRGRAWLAGGPKLDKAVGADWKAPPDLSQGKKK